MKMRTSAEELNNTTSEAKRCFMIFKELKVGDKFKCLKDNGRDLVYVKRKSNDTVYLHDNATVLPKV